MDDVYKVKACRGLCQQVDDIGMCIGLCSTDFSYARTAYFKHKENFLAAGKPWEEIEDFERPPQPKPAPEQRIPVQEQEVQSPDVYSRLRRQ
tara:strand:+ start:6664 stop:6939 length:276 start_codon:yes stop_codon:yes gene_type:complete